MSFPDRVDAIVAEQRAHGHVPCWDEIKAGRRHRLFVGDINCAEDYLLLRVLGVETVFNCTDDEETPEWTGRLRGYHQIKVDDASAHDKLLLSLLLEEAYLEKLDAALQVGNVLVHCHAGVQRSCTVVACYLVAHCGLTMPNATALVMRDRPWAFRTYNGTVAYTFKKTLRHFKSKNLLGFYGLCLDEHTIFVIVPGGLALLEVHENIVLVQRILVFH